MHHMVVWTLLQDEVDVDRIERNSGTNSRFFSCFSKMITPWRRLASVADSHVKIISYICFPPIRALITLNEAFYSVMDA